MAKRFVTIDNCQLEVDRSRGVLYVHSSEGVSLVRVCQIPHQVVERLQYHRRHRQWGGLIDVVFDRKLAKG